MTGVRESSAVGARRWWTPPSVRRELELIRISAIRQLKVRYRGSALGIFWSFANPMLMTALYTALFGTAFSRYYDGSTTRYVLSAFVGVVVATLFLQATNEALPSVVVNGGLLNKIELDPEIFPLASVTANMLQQLVTTFPLLLVVSAVITRDPVRVALVPLVLVALIVMVTAFALVLAALFVFFRDLGNIWGIAGFILWLTSPVFYPVDLVPASVRPFLAWNPVGQAITALREVTIVTGPLHRHDVVWFVAFSLAAGALGLALFRAQRRHFIDLV